MASGQGGAAEMPEDVRDEDSALDSYDDTIRQYVGGSTRSFVHVPIPYYKFSPPPSSVPAVKLNDKRDRSLDLLGNILSGFLESDTVQAPFAGRKRADANDEQHLSGNDAREQKIPCMQDEEHRSTIASAFVDITKLVVEPGARLSQSQRAER
eukprot:757508-Hanusia_phi.AAC.6